MLQYNGYGYVTHLLRKNPIVKFVGCLAIEITVVTMNYPKFSYSEAEAKSLENPDEVGGPKLKSVLRTPKTSALPLVCTPPSLIQVWNMSWRLILVVS